MNDGVYLLILFSALDLRKMDFLRPLIVRFNLKDPQFNGHGGAIVHICKI